MYDALSKGLLLATGEIIGYINAGDFLNKSALKSISDAFSFHEVNWVTGINCCCNENSQTTSIYTPFRYKQKLIREGFYGRHLPFIQQESTFWRSSLNTELDIKKLKNFKLAGDYFLWHSFSKKHKLYVINTFIGTFKNHSGQPSENISLYHEEMKKIRDKPTIISYINIFLEKTLQNLHQKLRFFFKTKSLWFDQKNSKWTLRK